jgi:hypothetical protein
MVLPQAFTFNVLGLGAARLAIGPLFVFIRNNHAMLIGAKNVGKHAPLAKALLISARMGWQLGLHSTSYMT